MKITFLLNGRQFETEADSTERLSDILKKTGKVSSVRTSCNKGECKSCSIMVNGDVVPSCMICAFSARGSEIVTLEGFSKTKDYNDIIQAFEETGVSPCDFCRGGTILTIQSILERFAEPGETQILDAFSGNICPCTDIKLIIEAVKKAAMYRKRKRIGRK